MTTEINLVELKALYLAGGMSKSEYILALNSYIKLQETEIKQIIKEFKQSINRD